MVRFLTFLFCLSFLYSQEEIRKLYGQLQQIKTASMEAGNRHLGRSSSILFGGSTPSLLNSSAPNNNSSTACLVNTRNERRHQRHSAAAELVSDYVLTRDCAEGGAGSPVPPPHTFCGKIINLKKNTHFQNWKVLKLADLVGNHPSLME